MNESVLAELKGRYGNLYAISVRMEDKNMEGYYNPDHPACWSRVEKSKHPAGELKKLALQLAMENPDQMRGLKAMNAFQWADMSAGVRRVASGIKFMEAELLDLGNAWKLRDAINSRCPDIPVWYEINFSLPSDALEG